ALSLVAAFILVFAPIFLLKKFGQSDDNRNYMFTSVKVDRGLYSLLRHPQYLGYMIFNFGFILISQQIFAVLLGASSIMFLHFQVIDEEKYCLGKFGAGYEDYKKRVPRYNLILGIVRQFQNSRKL
ncbi:MAG: isoprenylcysteine carboxylmethyltransferase family protein, partial [Anaerolineaceae bacterium]|nr:isoprenylcysteine carboxylmethyltransferase family protein [Anaerolineaceae bacterium]